MQGTALSHDAFVYDSDEEFLAAMVPFLAGAVEAGEGAVAVTTPSNIELLRRGMGEVGGAVQFVDSDVRYRRVIDTIAEYEAVMREFQRQRMAFRVLGEVRFGLTPEQQAEWARYESIFNRVFERSAAWVVCPYDRRELPEPVVDDATRTHPFTLDGHERRPNTAYVEPEEFVPSRALPLPGTSDIPTRVVDVDGSNFEAARHALESLARRASLDQDRARELVSGLNELVTNALVHGGGRAMVRLWLTPDFLTCEVCDWGPGVDDPLLGYRPPDPFGKGGRGLWLARRLFDRVELMRGSSSGLTARAFARL